MPTLYTQAEDATRLLRQRLQRVLCQRQQQRTDMDRMSPVQLPADLRVELHNLLILLWNNAEELEIRDLFSSLNRCSGGATSLSDTSAQRISAELSSSESASPTGTQQPEIHPVVPPAYISIGRTTSERGSIFGDLALTLHLEDPVTSTIHTITFMLPPGSYTPQADGNTGMVVDLRSLAPLPTKEPTLCYACGMTGYHDWNCDRKVKL